MTLYYGKYRGKVEMNIDPNNQGRIMVSVPAVTGSGQANWALPCVPFAGPGVGFFGIPPIGADVWVEYEGGDPDVPIWSGCFWSQRGDAPASPALPQTFVIKTDAGMLSMSSVPPDIGVIIKNDSGMSIKMGKQSLEITTGLGKIEIQGQKISLNGNALEVT
jgi:uncharacterized protein involved in type VI secretion and phage assembly